MVVVRLIVVVHVAIVKVHVAGIRSRVLSRRPVIAGGIIFTLEILQLRDSKKRNL